MKTKLNIPTADINSVSITGSRFRKRCNKRFRFSLLFFFFLRGHAPQFHKIFIIDERKAREKKDEQSLTSQQGIMPLILLADLYKPQYLILNRFGRAQTGSKRYRRALAFIKSDQLIRFADYQRLLTHEFHS